MLSWSFIGSTGGKEKDKVGSWRKNTEYISEFKVFKVSSQRLCIEMSDFREVSTSGSFLIKGMLLQHHLS